LFETSDVVSLHAPNVPANRGLITEALLASLPEGGTFLNTARGALVDEAGMARVAAARPDLTFLLDVTDPEPPAPDSPLFRLSNVVLTPHIAGCEGAECRRMGGLMLDEYDRFVRGEPLLHRYPSERRAHLA
jgi:phosphoglycerate dehydrogenase-like enzyme